MLKMPLISEKIIVFMKKILLAVSLLLFSVYSYAQEKEISKPKTFKYGKVDPAAPAKISPQDILGMAIRTGLYS